MPKNTKRKSIKTFEDFNNNKIYGWHVTRRSNIPSILKNGLEPRIPEDFGEKGDVEGVYLFKSAEDVTTALSQWMGEIIEDWEEENDEEYDEIVLKVDLTHLTKYLIDTVEYEWTCVTTIPPKNIISIHKPTWTIEKDIIKKF